MNNDQNDNRVVLKNIKAKGVRTDDVYYTPLDALTPILPLIANKYTRVWEPFAGGNHIANFLETNGFEVIKGDIVTGQDFFNYEPEKYDIIISNPPFSLKTKILKRLYELGKPFLLLMTISAIDSIERLHLYKENGISLYLLPKRTNFIKPGSESKSSAWFYSCWFGWNLRDGAPNTITHL